MNKDVFNTEHVGNLQEKIFAQTYSELSSDGVKANMDSVLKV